jgi:hypothetical protein
MPSLPKSIPININNINAGIPNLSENLSANTQSKITQETAITNNAIGIPFL